MPRHISSKEGTYLAMPGIHPSGDVGVELDGDDVFKSHRSSLPPDITIGREKFEATKRRFEGRYLSESSEDLNRRKANLLENQPATDLILPPTPPLNFHGDLEDEALEDKIVRDHILAARSFSSGISTPLVQRSPPTPETTPPRAATNGVGVLSPSRNPSLDTQAESFRTAREDLASEDEAEEVDSPSLRPSRQMWLRDTGGAQFDPVGLGLNMVTMNDQIPSGETTPIAARPKTWQSTTRQRSPTLDEYFRPHTEPDPTPVDKDKRRGKVLGQLVRTQHTISTETAKIVKDLDVEYAKDNVREKRRKLRRSPDDEALQRFAQEIKWPVSEEDPLLYSSPRSQEAIKDDARRESHVSTHSTVVEAMVIASAAPSRQQTLRRTSKVPRFDLTGETIAGNRDSSISAASRSTRKRLRHASSPEVLLHSDLSSKELNLEKSRKAQSPPSARAHTQMSDLAYRSASHASQDSGPSQLRSALAKPTTAADNNESKSRPTTAPEASPGYFDVPRGDRRITSMYAAPGSVGQSSLQTPKKSRQSKLFAEVSPGATPGKVTAEVNEAAINTRQQTDVPRDKASASSVLSPSNQPMQVIERPTATEWNALRPSSALVTPFSLRSAQSSTPGTLEVNEATAISIYPHTNKSILVVQQTSQTSDSLEDQPTLIAGNAGLDGTQSVKEPRRQREGDVRINPSRNGVDGYDHERHQSFSANQRSRFRRDSAIVDQVLTRTDSPLKNPRVAPMPPDLRLIAATPRTEIPSPQSHQADALVKRRSSRRGRLAQPLSAMRRSLSGRRFSESVVIPISRGLSLSRRREEPAAVTTYRKRNRRQVDSRRDSLHPFWRPRSFWNGLSDDESEPDFGNDGQLPMSSSSAKDNQRHHRQGSLPLLGNVTSNDERPSRSRSLSSRLTGSLRLPIRDRSISIARRPSDPETDQKENPFAKMRRRLSMRRNPSTANETAPSRRNSLLATSTNKIGDLIDRQKSLRRTKKFGALNHNEDSYEFITTNPTNSKRSSRAVTWDSDGSRPVSNGQIIDSYARRTPLRDQDPEGGLYVDEHDDTLSGIYPDGYESQEDFIPRQGYPVEFIAPRPVVDSFSSFHTQHQQSRAASSLRGRSRPTSMIVPRTTSSTSASIVTAGGKNPTRRYSLERRDSSNHSRAGTSNTKVWSNGGLGPGTISTTTTMTTTTTGSNTPRNGNLHDFPQQPRLRRGVRKDETVREIVKRMTGVVIPPTV